MAAFLDPLPVERIPGVVRVTEERLKQLGAVTVGELRDRTLEELEGRFGRYGPRLHALARGVDPSPVIADRPVRSISAEDTFAKDIPLSRMEVAIRSLAEKVWAASRREVRKPRTVVLKLKTAGFETLTRSFTPGIPPASAEELAAMALALRERVTLPLAQLYRLARVGLSNFCEEEGSPATLFEPVRQPRIDGTE